jgi:hypothetical protein
MPEFKNLGVTLSDLNVENSTSISSTLNDPLTSGVLGDIWPLLTNVLFAVDRK